MKNMLPLKFLVGTSFLIIFYNMGTVNGTIKNNNENVTFINALWEECKKCSSKSDN